MPSSITITFNNLPVPGDNIFFRVNPRGGFIQSLFSEQRTQPQQVEISTSSLELQVFLLEQAFKLDYNQFNEYSFDNPSNNSLRITKDVGENFFQNATVQGVNTSYASINISSSPDPINLIVTDFNYSTSSINPCGSIDLNITTSKQVDLVRYINQDINPTTNPFTLNISRALTPRIQFFSNGEEYRQVFYPPVQFFIDRVDQRFTPNGYAAQIIVTASGLTQMNILNVVEYSLDDINYQMSNSFPGLLSGNYTAYVKDPYGCKKQIEFTIVEDESSANRLEDYFMYPKSNSIQMVFRDNKPNNIENTLSCEEEGLNQIPFTHKVLNTWDSLPNQFRSNFDIHTLNLVNESGDITPISVEKVTNNINIFDSRDAYLKVYDDMCVGVYLNGGNIYDSQTLDILTNQSNLVGKLPIFYKKDSFIKLGNDIGWYQITEIIYDEELSFFVAKTSYRANSVDSNPIIATSNYNQLPYEVYEFDIDWTNYNGCYYLTMECTRDSTVKLLQSEVIEVSESFRQVHELISSNTENNTINYNTQRQINHRLLLPYIDLKSYSSSTEVDSSRNDTKITHLSGSVTDRVIFNFDLIPGSMVQKIIRLVSLDRLFINGIGYTNPEVDDEKIGNTNMYSLAVTLTPNNEQFETNSDLRVISNVNNTGYLVSESGGGFIKHDN